MKAGGDPIMDDCRNWKLADLASEANTELVMAPPYHWLLSDI